MKPKSSQALANRSMLPCISECVLAFSAQSSSKTKSRTVSSCTLVFACSLRGLRSFPSVRYQKPTPMTPVSPVNVMPPVNAIPTLNVIPINRKCNTNRKCNSNQPQNVVLFLTVNVIRFNRKCNTSDQP